MSDVLELTFYALSCVPVSANGDILCPWIHKETCTRQSLKAREFQSVHLRATRAKEVSCTWVYNMWLPGKAIEKAVCSVEIF